MKRRDLLLAPWVFGGAVRAWPQVAGRTYRVGYLGARTAGVPGELPEWSAWVRRLGELGYRLGDNLVIEVRYANGPREHYAEFAAEMVRIRADAVVVSSGTMARYVMGLSATIPIVALSIEDPIRAGLIASLGHPGGQLTGLSDLSDELVPKQLELLKAAVPSARRIAYARCPFCAWSAGLSRAGLRALFAEQEVAAHALGVTLVAADLSDVTQFSGTAAVLRRDRVDALLIGANVINVATRAQWLALATRQRLPTMAAYRSFGAMLSYGPDQTAIHCRAAELVARILGGVSPGELPMEQPTRLEFVVNLQLAKSMGVVLPQSLLLRADEVIA